MLSVLSYENGVAAHGKPWILFCWPRFGKSCSVLQVCSMYGGFGLVQDHGLGHLGVL